MNDKVLIIVANSSLEVESMFTSGAVSTLDKYGIDYDSVTAPQIVGVPSVLGIVLDSFEYDGVIILGAIMRQSDDGTGPVNDMYNLEYLECVRGVNDLAMHFTLPVGFGIVNITPCSDGLLRKIMEVAAKATESCIELIKIKQLHQAYNATDSGQYKHN
ncbi:hypothetical protein EDM53_00060 [Rickettsiales endosymbiont of Peranema trichophorum]|uniref:6,7-dimethyl-8-ribityllumazine synthase n=1 Tax=Rickettsiales endosymbiont of Peranema trichophorum TaxID=2486577 RepID=UPI0010237F6D|nr:6,7-dimethyl-8-ribityllumazine synthase [Rickettsiales endosymbiont of Peranema trichophorum]RZI47775.1 hypothetical protein EDM53_00060 [Rickettsiales endosymbiont of Peranema trichophorum]